MKLKENPAAKILPFLYYSLFTPLVSPLFSLIVVAVVFFSSCLSTLLRLVLSLFCIFVLFCTPRSQFTINYILALAVRSELSGLQRIGISVDCSLLLLCSPLQQPRILTSSQKTRCRGRRACAARIKLAKDTDLILYAL